jgi:hypothetical protein
MFLGEFLCLLVFKFVWFSTARYRIQQMTYKGDHTSAMVRFWPLRINRDTALVAGEQVFNPLIFWVASLFDMLSTSLSYFALNLTTASTFQMLRGSVMVFTAIFRCENDPNEDESMFSSASSFLANACHEHNGLALLRLCLV